MRRPEVKMPAAKPERGFYYHYKHDPSGPIENYAYEVTGIGWHTEETYALVHYRPLYPDAEVYVAGFDSDDRPLAMWMEYVTHGGISVPRFSKITDEGIIAKLKEQRDSMYGK